MPLRSVEAATRDDAIAAAREQFGPGARVVGVRRVRSGGVLGFFATERYVAEVDPDHASRTAGRERAARRAEVAPPRPAAVPDRVSELAGLLGHAPGEAADTALPTYNRATVARPSAAREFLAHEPERPLRAFRPEPAEPSRSGSTRWEPTRWEPARSEPVRPEPVRAEPARSEPVAFDWSRFEAARASGRPSSAEPAPGSLRIRAGAAEPAPAPWSVAASVLAAEESDPRDDRDDRDDDAPGTGESLPPSPFTAALARMVAGDRDVRQAVQAALDDRAVRDERVPGRPARDDAEPPRPRSTAPAATPVKTGAGHQEEEPVVEQDDVSTSLRTEVRPTEFPAWAEPEPAPEPASRREEAIAEVLRAALAQGHSDEALTSILRKVLDGASPQAALTEEAAAATALPAEPEPPAAPVDLPHVDLPHVDLPQVDVPVEPAPAAEALVAETPVGEPLTAEAPAADLTPVDVPEPIVPEPAAAGYRAPEPTLATPYWVGSGQSLWGEPVVGPHTWGSTTLSSGYRDLAVDEPIWAEVVLQEPAPATATPVAEPVWETPTFDATPAVDSPIGEDPIAEPPVTEDPIAEDPIAEDPIAEAPIVEAPIVAAPSTEESRAVETPVVETPVVEAPVVEESRAADEPLIATLARTASDPAPLPLDATAVMPPLSLLPPLPSSARRGGGLPPVPPMPSRSLLSPSRPAAGRAAAEARTEPAPSPAPAPMKTLATVTRLPVAPLEDLVEAAEEEPAMVESPVAEVPVAPQVTSEPLAAPAPAAEPVAATAPEVAPTPAVPVPAAPAAVPAQPAGLVGRLRALGIPEWLLGPSFTADVAAHGTYAALTRALAAGLPAAPAVPDGAGEVLLVVGPGVETLRAARSLAASLRLDPDRVQWASRGDLAGLAPEYSRVTTIETAIERRQDATLAGTVTIVAVDAPLRTDAYWISQMLAIWAPEAVWAVVDATRKPEDVGPWIDGLPRVDALMVEDTDLSADPAAVLHRIAMPVALLDGVPATPHRWASLLCERLEKHPG